MNTGGSPEPKRPPLHYYKFTLPFKAVHLQCLDKNKNPIKYANATGFFLKQNDAVALYTCWHVVTEHDMHNIRIQKPSERRFLRLNLQDVANEVEGITRIGGLQSVDIPLYEEEGSTQRPLWLQDEKDVPNEDLNAIGIRVPFWHDAVKLAVPEGVKLSDIQIIDVEDALQPKPQIGDKVLIVGYPYGYSSFGMHQPTPVTITRFVASDCIEGRRQELLLDGPAAPGMSGGPVFIEHGNMLRLIGIYTGAIYPDHIIEKNEKTTALGTFCLLDLALNYLPLKEIPRPSNAS